MISLGFVAAETEKVDSPSASCGSFGSGEQSRLCRLMRVDLIVKTGLQASIEGVK
jgi:hypothetical protein